MIHIYIIIVISAIAIKVLSNTDHMTPIPFGHFAIVLTLGRCTRIQSKLCSHMRELGNLNPQTRLTTSMELLWVNIFMFKSAFSLYSIECDTVYI